MKRSPTDRATQTAHAAQFLWHFDAGFRDRFEHHHWWKGEPADIPLDAAFWELIRRNPKARTVHEADYLTDDGIRHCLSCLGLKSWSSMARRERAWWREVVMDLPPKRGFDPRTVVSLTLASVHLDSGAPPQCALTLSPSLKERAKRNTEARLILDAARQARADEVARLAREHHLNGRIILSIPEGTASLEKLADAVVRCIRAHGPMRSHGKARVADWLGVIAQFEQAEEQGIASRGFKRPSQLFARYRRVITGVGFPAK